MASNDSAAPTSPAVAVASPTTSPKQKDTDSKPEVGESKVVTLPMSRVKTIMKSSPDVSNISQESLFLIAKATELFVDHLTHKALEKSVTKNKVEYRALADFVNGEDTMQFLQDIIPHKIKYGDYLRMMEDDSDVEVISSSSDDSDNESVSSDSSDDDVTSEPKLQNGT